MTFFRLIRRLLLVSPALLIVLSCGGDEAQSLAQATVSPTAESLVQTNAAEPTASPAPSSLAIENLRLLFLRHPRDAYEPRGELWVSDGDGSNQRRLSPEGVAATYAGKIQGKSGNVIAYFVTKDSEGDRSVWRVDADSGVAQSVFSYEARPESIDAAVSPDGGHIAYVESLGLSLLDVVTGETRRLSAVGDLNACSRGEVSECPRDVRPQWSPDGVFLLVTTRGWEGGRAHVISAFADPPVTWVPGNAPFSGNWSLSGNAICAMGRYDRQSGLYLLNAPGWQPNNLLPEYEEVGLNPQGLGVEDCAWVSESEVAHLTFSWNQSGVAEIGVLDVAAGSHLTVIRFDDLDPCCSFGLLTDVEGGRSVVAQFPEYVEDNAPRWDRPQLIDIDSGQSQPILEIDDVVVAAFTR